MPQALNEYVDKACYVDEESGHIKCRNVGNEFILTVHGFPVDTAEASSPPVFYLYDSVFNEMPKGWDDVREYWKYEQEKLTPWLQSMGFEDVRWGMGESDSFGPLSRVARMRLKGHIFEFIYG